MKPLARVSVLILLVSLLAGCEDMDLRGVVSDIVKTNLVKRPRISLRQETTAISTGESFDFGTVVVGDSKDVVFTIENKGTTVLNLTNTPRVIVTGSSAFAVPTPPPAAVAAGSTASFTVRFTPQDTTLVAATIYIKSDDPETGTYVVALSGKGSSGTLTDAQSVAADKASLQIIYTSGDSAISVTQNMTLPTSGSNGTTVSWISDTPGAISNAGVVVRPAAGTTNATVVLTATIFKGTTSDTKPFTLTVVKNPFSDTQCVADDKAGLQIIFAGGDSISSVTQNLTLPAVGSSGTSISWASDNTGIVSVAGVVMRPTSTTAVTLTATITKGAVNDSKVFAVTVILAAPAAPGSLIAQATSSSAIHLSWTDASSNESGFKVERSPDGSSGWNQVQLTAANATIWDDAGLSAGTTYYYRVRASNAAGDSPFSNTVSDTTYMPSFSGGVAIKAVGDSFTMGDGSYGPNVSESLSYNFTMSKYEITNGQFAQFIADGGYTNQSYWTTNGWAQKTPENWTQPLYWTYSSFNGTNQPVVGVSWYEAVAYCNWRSIKEGLTAAYNVSGQANLSATGYRLPTEVEWEYAAAKGASGQVERIYAWGDTWDSSKAACSVFPASATETADVGSKSTGNPTTTGDTPQGLADMSGNVWEWCSDNYNGSVTSGTDRYYFVDDSTSQYPVVRGGAWHYTHESYFRCAFRLNNDPYNRNIGVGFRVVRP